MGPVERLKPMPVMFELELVLANGRNVGVAGREVGVGNMLDVVEVLRVDPDSREEGRRMPVVVVLRPREVSFRWWEL